MTIPPTDPPVSDPFAPGTVHTGMVIPGPALVIRPAPSPLSTITPGKITAWIGFAVAAIGFLNTAPVLKVIPPSWAAILTVLGAAVSRYGGLLHTDQTSGS